MTAWLEVSSALVRQRLDAFGDWWALGPENHVTVTRSAWRSGEKDARAAEGATVGAWRRDVDALFRSGVWRRASTAVTVWRSAAKSLR